MGNWGRKLMIVVKKIIDEKPFNLVSYCREKLMSNNEA